MKTKKVKKILKNISFTPCAINIGFEWGVKKCKDGFYIRTTFQRPDTNTGELGEGFGRWMFVEKKSDEKSVVMTAWICVELIVKHEMLESFLYKSQRLFGPHKTLEELAYPEKLKNN